MNFSSGRRKFWSQATRDGPAPGDRVIKLVHRKSRRRDNQQIAGIDEGFANDLEGVVRAVGQHHLFG